MPPDSSAPSSSQFHHAGRWGVDNLRDKNTRSTQGTSTENSSSTPQQGLTPLEAGFGRKSSPVESPPGTPDHSEKEEISGDVAVDKRVTRAANGISKKVPVDPNNVVKHPYFFASSSQKGINDFIHRNHQEWLKPT